MTTRAVALIASLSLAGVDALVAPTHAVGVGRMRIFFPLQRPLHAFKVGVLRFMKCARKPPHAQRCLRQFYGEEARQASGASAVAQLNRHISIDLDYPGLKVLHRSWRPMRTHACGGHSSACIINLRLAQLASLE